MKPAGERLRILVLGYIVRCPLGGMAWHYAQYVAGLAALGHDVYFLEDSDDYRETCYDPSTGTLGPDPTVGLGFAFELFGRLGLRDRWAYYDAHTRSWRGPCADTAGELCASADVLINVSGSHPARAWFDAVPTRVYVDTDPAFEQVRQLTDPGRRARAGAHNRFFTFGANYGQPECTIPDTGSTWHPTRQPILLDRWPVLPPPQNGRLTTVMQWDSYAPLSHDGVDYGMKSASFDELMDLPSTTETVLELALGSKGAPRDLLRAKGWRLRNPLEVTVDPWTYQDYITGSLGELGIAKQGYVRSRSGWFSERSAAYLACGRPVIAQDTGFSTWLPPGDGLLPFVTREGARDAIARVTADPHRHHVAARALAEEFFDAAAVLARLIETATASDPVGAP